MLNKLNKIVFWNSFFFIHSILHNLSVILYSLLLTIKNKVFLNFEAIFNRPNYVHPQWDKEPTYLIMILGFDDLESYLLRHLLKT